MRTRLVGTLMTYGVDVLSVVCALVIAFLLFFLFALFRDMRRLGGGLPYCGEGGGGGESAGPPMRDQRRRREKENNPSGAAAIGIGAYGVSLPQSLGWGTASTTENPHAMQE